jgi:hypothetical protein
LECDRILTGNAIGYIICSGVPLRLQMGMTMGISAPISWDMRPRGTIAKLTQVELHELGQLGECNELVDGFLNQQA